MINVDCKYWVSKSKTDWVRYLGDSSSIIYFRTMMTSDNERSNKE